MIFLEFLIILFQEEFEQLMENGDIYEYDIHHNHYYGSSKKMIDEKARNGIVIKDIDVNRNGKIERSFKRYRD